jgi:hypothetical protein
MRLLDLCLGVSEVPPCCFYLESYRLTGRPNRLNSKNLTFQHPESNIPKLGISRTACRWDDCYAELDSFQRLQEHIEKVHLKVNLSHITKSIKQHLSSDFEQRLYSLRCRWENCPQRSPYDSLQRLHRHVLAHAASLRYCIHAGAL